MDVNIFQQKNEFPRFVQQQLEKAPIDFLEKHLSLLQLNATGANQLEAGVAVLLIYKNSEYVFQLIRRSNSVAQGGDISCPGGMLDRSTDEMLSHILFQTDMIRRFDGSPLSTFSGQDTQSASLIRLFLMNALREAWEEIGLPPLNTDFLGALPTYSLDYFARTIFPVVCLVRESYDFRLNPEVEQVLEIPLGFFFRDSSYALAEIDSSLGSSDPRYQIGFPCLVIPSESGKDDILWGATFHIVTNFLRIITGGDFSPPASPSRRVQKTLPSHYSSGNR